MQHHMVLVAGPEEIVSPGAEAVAMEYGGWDSHAEGGSRVARMDKIAAQEASVPTR